MATNIFTIGTLVVNKLLMKFGQFKTRARCEYLWGIVTYNSLKCLLHYDDVVRLMIRWLCYYRFIFRANTLVCPRAIAQAEASRKLRRIRRAPFQESVSQSYNGHRYHRQAGDCRLRTHYETLWRNVRNNQWTSNLHGSYIVSLFQNNITQILDV